METRIAHVSPTSFENIIRANACQRVLTGLNFTGGDGPDGISIISAYSHVLKRDDR